MNKRIKRLTEWWRPKAGTILSLLLFYLVIWDVPFSEAWKLLLFSVITLTGFGLTGYFLNDWADISFDRKAGKTNLVDGISTVWRPFIFVLLVAFTLFPWFVYFKTDRWSVALIVFQFVLQLAYPVPPIRLKNFPVAAIFTDSLYAFVVPSILAWHTFDLTTSFNENLGQRMHFVFLGFWMLSMGVRHIIAHHVADRENDLQSGSPNLSLRVAPFRLRALIQSFVYPIELICGVGFFASFLQFYVFVPMLALSLLVVAGAGEVRPAFPFFSITFFKTRTDRFVSFYLGFLCSFLLFLGEVTYGFILLLFVLLFTDLLAHPLLRIGMKRLWKWPMEQLSLIFNWSIYYFRKWVLRWSEERNWGGHYPKRLKQLESDKRGENGIVAVFNHNYAKYTETFVAGHLKQLPFKVVFFHGWPSPTHVGEMESLIADEGVVRSAMQQCFGLLNMNFGDLEDRRIAERLVREKVDVILAEFGTMGARLVDISNRTGIPMIVTFYGYDAWHRKELDENMESYVELFKEAACVIGVSQDICTQLEKLGCSPHKISYLPCYVDLNRFAWTPKQEFGARFLAVGRFCHTKAPHLTILAFAEVRKQRSDSKLVMIGADDGNGVLESCIALIRALTLQDCVELLGAQPPERVLAEMKAADVFVQHSITTPIMGDKEGTPVSVMEAMAIGLPVVATRHAGIAEMVVDGSTGILVDEFNYIRMAEGMLRLINDPKLMTQMGNVAAEHIRSNELVSRNVEILSEIIDRHRLNK